MPNAEDAIAPDLPLIRTERLDDPIEDRLRDTRSVAQLVNTDPVGEGFDVPTEPVGHDADRPVEDVEGI